MDKRARKHLFHQRLLEALRHNRTNRSELARATGVSRSTISQLLNLETTRLPNAQLAADCAQALGVSSDWLLGLTDRPERPGDIVASALELAQAARTLSDDQIMQWHREAAGYKIRHVPASMPDMLKTQAVLRWEYAAFLGKTPDQAIGAMEDRIGWLRSTGSDYEIAVSIQEVRSMAAGEGYYRGLERGDRLEQLVRLADNCRELFPSLRLHLYDARRIFSAPVTIFGPRIGVIYVGSFYLAFRESSRVGALSNHFDGLVREAEIDARDAAEFLQDLTARAI